MRSYFFILLFFSQIAFAQKDKQVMEEKGDRDCFYKNVYSATQRLKFYPYSVCDSIKLVSFKYHVQGIPVVKDSVVVDSLIEIKNLSENDILKLTDIICNNFFRDPPNYGISYQCYFPRNAILFYDKNGSLKESIVICFHCENYKVSSQKIRMGDECTEKMGKLRNFFVSSGIKFGTDPDIISYPGETLSH